MEKLGDIFNEILAASVWEAPSIDVQPVMRLSNWSVVKVSDNGQEKLKFVGYNLIEMVGRVSSTIIGFDRKTMTAITRSGRRYELVGEPGIDPDGWHVLHMGWGDKDITNVTKEFLESYSAS